GINLADGFPGLDPQVVMGVRSATGREAYYAVRITNPAVQKTQGGVSTAIVYFGVDNEGVIRPGVWSYAQSITSVSPYGQEPRSPIVIFDPETDALRQNYLSVLGG
ncbi:MAG TPA: hypothetical protein VKT80_16865, partial [Chloroflexota bacterium]|nr:hypothetical protein [Chloroflexota bacterium]